jgi:hypothetical protein
MNLDKENIMTKRNIIIGGTVMIIVILGIGLFFLQRIGAERVLRRTIISNLDQADETAAELQRTEIAPIIGVLRKSAPACFIPILKKS